MLNRFFPPKGDIDYWSKGKELETLDELMINSSFIQNSTTDSWFQAMSTWLKTTSDPAILVRLDNGKLLK